MKLTRTEWKPYFEALASRMRLGGWKLEISERPPRDDSSIASVSCWHGRNTATIFLSDAFLDEENGAEQRDTVVHELVHCYFAQSDKIVEQNVFGPAYQNWRLATEYGVDAVADTIARGMPLPSEFFEPKG